MTKGKTHYEDGRYYAVIRTPSGHEYYSGPKDNYVAAYRYSVKETEEHYRAAQNHSTYNTRGL